MFDPDKRLLFYPSCGFAPYKLFELDFDQFVLADKGPRDNHSKEEFYRRLSRNVGGVELLEKRPDCRIFRKAGKDVYLFFNDNNDVLELIRSSACRIDCFIGIRDGCSEGGNYECVNDREFFSKILPLMPETGMDYITDHPELMFTRWGAGRRSERSERPCDELIIRDKRIVLSGKVALKLADNPISPVRRYKVSRHQPSVREWRTRTIRVTLEHDDITNWWSTLDGKFTSMRCRRWAGWTDRSNYRVAPDHFFKPSLKPGWTTEDSTLLPKSSYLSSVPNFVGRDNSSSLRFYLTPLKAAISLAN